MGITSGLILGMAYVAAPGPINVETLRQGMKGGITGSLALQGGSAVGLVLYAMLALLGMGLLIQDATWQLAAGVAGTAVLIYLGVTTIRDWCDLVLQAADRGPGRVSPRGAFWTGAVLSLANPLDIVFWMSIGSRILYDPGLDAWAFLSGFFMGCLLTSLAVALFAGFWQSRLTFRAARVISLACGLALIGFGLRLGLSTGQQLVVW